MPIEVRASRPTISIDGKNIGALATGLLGLRVSDEAGGLAACELLVGNWGSSGSGTTFLYDDRKLLEFGKPIQVKVANEVVFDGRITALEGHYPQGDQPMLTVLAEDRLQDLRMTRRTRTFNDVSDADVFRKIAQGHGLSADIDLTGPTHKVLAQVNCSDLAFLRERARACGAELWAEGKALKAKSRDKRRGTAIRLGYGNELRELVVSADLAHQRTAVTVGGWDVANAKAIAEKASEDAVQSELKEGDGGATVLRKALGDRSEPLAGATPRTTAEAKARAESAFRARARRFLSGRGIADPTAGLRAGATVKLEGVGKLFSGEWFVTGVVHRFDAIEGLRTEFTVERPWIGRAA